MSVHRRKRSRRHKQELLHCELAKDLRKREKTVRACVCMCIHAAKWTSDWQLKCPRICVCSSGSEAGDHCRVADIQSHVSQQLSHPGATLGCWLLQLGTREMRTHGCILWVGLHLCIKLLPISCLSLRCRPVFRASLFSPASLYNFQLLSSLWVTRQYLCVHLTFPRVLSSSAHLPLQITHGNLCDDTWWFIQWKALCTLPLPVCYSLREWWRVAEEKRLCFILWAGALMERRTGQMS